MQLSQGLRSESESYSPCQSVCEDEGEDDDQLELQNWPSQGFPHADHQALKPESSTPEEFQAKTHKVLCMNILNLLIVIDRAVAVSWK